ncbi:MAG: DMT family transporter [Chloroflexi bacterium]|nr:DMT family transporter [Chloroflexota bacterium]
MSGRATSLAGLVAIVWGLCFVLIQASLPSSTPLLLAALRALIGGGAVVAWIAVSRRRPGTLRPARPPVQRSWLPGLPSISLLFVLALTNAALALGAMYLAAGRAEAAVASILAAGQPLILAVAGWTLFGERLAARTLTGLVVAMFGVVLVAGASSGVTTLEGVVLAVLASVAPAAGTILMRRLAPSVDLLVTTGVQFLLGGAILLAVSAVLEPWATVTWSPAILAGLLVLGVLGTGLAYVAWFWLLDRVSLVGLGAALFLVPVVGVIAAIVTGDRPAPVGLAGIAVVLVGLAIVSVGGSTAPASADPINRGRAERRDRRPS